MYDFKKINYLKDIIELLKENAFQAHNDYHLDNADYFKMGINFGYYEVFKILIEQAKAFDIDLSELGLGDLDPEKDLLKMK